MLLVKRAPAYVLAVLLAVVVLALLTVLSTPGHHLGGAAHAAGRHQLANIWWIVQPKG